MLKQKLFAMLVAGLTVLTVVVQGADSLLKNSKLELDENNKLSNWRVNPRDTTLEADNQNLPEKVTNSIKFKVADIKNYDGSICQSVYIKGGTPKTLTLSSYMKASSPRCAYLQIKLYKNKKELKRINVAYSKKKWEKYAKQFNSEGADKVEVNCRWRRYERYQGTTVCFADIKLSEAGKVVGLVGDSTVKTYAKSSNRRGWGQLLSEFVTEDTAVINYAEGGKSSKTFRSEKRWDKVLKDKPNIVLIQFGHNDSHAPGRPESTQADKDFLGNIKQYIVEAKAAGIIPILVTPPHRRVFKTEKELSAVLKPYSESIKSVAQDKNILCVDLYSFSESQLLQLGQEGSKPLYCSNKDRSHFSEKGARLLAKHIAKTLENSPIEVSSIIKKK